MLKQLMASMTIALVATTAVAQQQERDQIPAKYTWDLTQIYPTDEAWRAAKEQFAAKMGKAAEFKGTLAQSPQQLLNALDTLAGMNKELSRLYVYTSLKSDQDTRQQKYQAMNQEMSKLATDFSTVTAYVEPEILHLDRAKIDAWLKQEPKLGIYAHYLDDILRRQPHTLSEAEEKIIADAGLMSDTSGDVYGIFADADFPYPSVTLSDGRTVRIDKSSFNQYRAVKNRADREKVMSTFFDTLGKYRATFGSTYSGKINKDLFYMRARHYDTTVHSTLDQSNIPVAVYTSLIAGVHDNLDTFHRYLRLRKRIMNVDQLHYYDLYAPLVQGVKLDYTIDESQKQIVAAVAPLGPDYQATIQKAFNERWIDLYPNPGKRSGAYSQGGAYDVHPYMLINYNGHYNDMSTLAHELGHTMQSYLSNRNQPYPTADYPTFVAEVASTFNEALLIDHMLKQIKDDDARLSLLGDYLENIKGTVFRQAQFAEFELRAHAMAEKGEPLTGESLDKLYAEITKQYYGHDKGVCIVDDYVTHEWAMIPHFYRNYYVFQYATSFTASQALSEKVLAGDKAATQRYLAFLSAGGSKYPIDLLKDAGVDMTTSEPLQLTVKKMNRIMDEMEKILDKKKS
jgi:oligoendopeptidase F